MASDRIVQKYREAFEALERYDQTRKLEIGRKRIDITLDRKLVRKLDEESKARKKPKSRIIEEALKKHLRVKAG